MLVLGERPGEVENRFLKFAIIVAVDNVIVYQVMRVQGSLWYLMDGTSEAILCGGIDMKYQRELGVWVDNDKLRSAERSFDFVEGGDFE